MDNKDFINIGEQIRDTVQTAIDSMDFKQLNQNITNTVNTALDEARKQLEQHRGNQTWNDDSRYKQYNSSQNKSNINGREADKTRHDGQTDSHSQEGAKAGNYQTRYKSGNFNHAGQVRWPNPNRAWDSGYTRDASSTGKTVRQQLGQQEFRPPIIRVKQVGRISGILCTVFGWIGISVSGIALFTVFVFGILLNPATTFSIAGCFALLLLIILFSALTAQGISTRNRFKRLKFYLKKSQGKTYCSIKELEEGINKSHRFVINDLRRMIRLGMLPEGHIDEQETCVMLNETAYRQYQQAQAALKQRQRLEQKQESESGKPFTELDKMSAKGEEYLKILHEANNAISSEVITEKLNRLELLISKIFETVRRHPNQMDEMEKFMEYYLPTTVKLINAYRDFDSVEIQGSNITGAKAEIEKTLDTINMAFERLLDDMYQDAAFDASTDASVLQTMLAKDGWMGSDFKQEDGK